MTEITRVCEETVVMVVDMKDLVTEVEVVTETTEEVDRFSLQVAH
eukprot:CAMPEP_0114330510 /NCGR_PEP_ID=MMETSP0101-20121206/1803_1 /TAXON_ID=38822 ORGANISM="Pteridomonas danica, Strain PT" /NCGR_SAMPLE_ID=MMETSP0101 /ASSEMBLY_ACC=CAM_ASM_000211 /LENGTH=44 /DNA_ID= /DNA_START= /DNA_END= /DNA_ORIENTATION=